MALGGESNFDLKPAKMISFYLQQPELWDYVCHGWLLPTIRKSKSCPFYPITRIYKSYCCEVGKAGCDAVWMKRPRQPATQRSQHYSIMKVLTAPHLVDATVRGMRGFHKHISLRVSMEKSKKQNDHPLRHFLRKRKDLRKPVVVGFPNPSFLQHPPLEGLRSNECAIK